MGEVYLNLLDGQRKKFEDINLLRVAIDDYFEDCDERRAPYTVSGLALALETNRKTLMNIQKADYYTNDFKQLVSLAKQKILSRTEEGMLSGHLNATGSIFTLKNNFGYVDKIEQVNTDGNNTNTLEMNRLRVIEANKVIECDT